VAKGSDEEDQEDEGEDEGNEDTYLMGRAKARTKATVG